VDPGYTRFVDELLPIALYMKSSSSLLRRDDFWRVFENEKLAGAVSNRLRVECSATDVGDSEFNVQSTASLSVVSSEETELLTIQCEFDLHFESGRGTTPDYVRQFAQTDARLVIWPYFREFIASMTSRMGIPPVSIPLSLGRRDSQLQ
jgi:preprotein translocase subunit SecB